MASTLERMMAVYEGRDGRGVVFQPRIKHWFEVNSAAGTLPDRYQGMYLDEVYRDLDVTPREVWVPGTRGSAGYLALKIEEGDDVEVWSRGYRASSPEGEPQDLVFTEYRTPKGSISQLERATEHGASVYNVDYFLKDLKDVEVMKYILQERRYLWDERRYEWGRRRFGDTIPLRVNLQRSPLMWLFVGLMGFQRAVTMIWRHPKEMEELLALQEGDFIKMLEVCRGKPITELHFGDNMHQDMCSPPYFKRYMMPFYKRVLPRVKEMGMYSTAHWDGFVGQLLPLVAETGLNGLECVTPLPQGDVTLEQMNEGMRGMFLRDGIPAVMMCPWTSLEALGDHVRNLIKLFYPRLILGISDLTPANADFERIRFVKGIVEEFNEAL